MNILDLLTRGNDMGDSPIIPTWNAGLPPWAMMSSAGGPASTPTVSPQSVDGPVPTPTIPSNIDAGIPRVSKPGINIKDILGAIGDGLSGQPLYYEQSQYQKMAPYLQNMVAGNDPVSAVKGMIAINPRIGMEMYQNLIASHIKAMQTQSEVNKNNAEAGKYNGETTNSIADIAGRMVTAGAASGNPDAYRASVARAKQMAPDLLAGVPDELPMTADGKPDLDAINKAVQSTIPQAENIKLQTAEKYKEGMLGIRQQNADTYAASAGNKATYQDRMAGAAERNAGAHETEAGARVTDAQARQTQAQVSDYKAHNPTYHGRPVHMPGSSSGGAAATPPPFAPGKAGRTVSGPSGIWYSPDGKTWVKH